MLKGRKKITYPKDDDIQPALEKNEKKGRKKKYKRNNPKIEIDNNNDEKWKR